MMASTPASAKAIARPRSLSRVPMAAPHSNLPDRSVEGAPGEGLINFSFKVEPVTTATSSPESFRIGSFPFLLSIFRIFHYPSRN
jgi:hypothetical protein